MPDETHDLTTYEGRNAFLHDTCDVEGYLEACRKTYEDDPRAINAAVQYAQGLKFLDRNEERYTRLREIRDAYPDSAMTNIALALTLLEEGRFREAWPYYQHRLNVKNALRENKHLPPKGRWQGEALSGRHVMLVAEQGLGDTLQFARYGIDLMRAGNQVALDAQPALRALLGGSPAIGTVPQFGEAVTIHKWTYVLELVPHFAPSIDNVTWPGAYVSPPATATPPRLPTQSDKDLRVGLAWYGNPNNDADALRSTSLADLAALEGVPGATFFGLQPKRTSGTTIDEQHTPWLVDISDQTFPFEALAQCIASLDVVVTVCTSIAHLAGAMGKPVYILLTRCPDWRWGRQGATTPWYPSARLFRQSRLGDWSDPVAELVTELEGL